MEQRGKPANKAEIHRTYPHWPLDPHWRHQGHRTETSGGLVCVTRATLKLVTSYMTMYEQGTVLRDKSD